MAEHAGHTVVLMNVPDELSAAKSLAVPQELTGKPFIARYVAIRWRGVANR